MVDRDQTRRDWRFWVITSVFGRFHRLNAKEVCGEWGEAFWTAPELWR